MTCKMTDIRLLQWVSHGVALTSISVISLIFTAMLSTPSQRSIAATSTTNLQINANVLANCTMNPATLAFGTYDPNGVNATAPLDMTGLIQIRCTKASTAILSLNNGLYNAQATTTTRAMKRNISTDYMNYEIYRNASRTTVWNASNTVSYTASSVAPSTVTLYGRIPQNQNVQNGGYSDTVVVTANF